MSVQISKRDPNRVTSLIGVDSIAFTDATTVAVDATTHEMLVKASFSGTGTVQGNLTNNNAAPGSNNLGVLPVIANAAAPSWTEGNQVLESVDLSGNQRVILKAETTKVIGTINISAGQTVAVTGSATGGAVPAGAFYQGVSDGANLQGVIQAKNSLDSSGGGIPTSQLVAQFDDVSPSTVTENQFGNLRMNSARQLYAQPIKKDTYATAAALTITLASLASSSVGVGRQSTLITSNTASSALITVKFTVGTTPTANSLIYVYLLRGDGTITDDNAGSSDAGITIINAPILGTILCPAATSNTAYYGVFDTKFLGSLATTFGIAIVNSTGATANVTGGNFAAQYTLIT